MTRLTSLFSLLLCLGLAACAAPAPTPIETEIGQSSEHVFTAQIIRMEGGMALVEALEHEWVTASSREFIFSAEGLPDIGALPGDYVGIVFSGEIRESFPAQIDVLNWFALTGPLNYYETAPHMTLSWGDHTAQLPAFPPIEWATYQEDGTLSAIIACGGGPLDHHSAYLSSEGADDVPIRLHSKDFPADELRAIAWNASVLDLPVQERWERYESAVELETKGENLQLPPDGEDYLVLATAVWNDKQDGITPFGSSCYLFLLRR